VDRVRAWGATAHGGPGCAPVNALGKGSRLWRRYARRRHGRVGGAHRDGEPGHGEASQGRRRVAGGAVSRCVRWLRGRRAEARGSRGEAGWRWRRHSGKALHTTERGREHTEDMGEIGASRRTQCVAHLDGCGNATTRPIDGGGAHLGESERELGFSAVRDAARVLGVRAIAVGCYLYPEAKLVTRAHGKQGGGTAVSESAEGRG